MGVLVTSPPDPKKQRRPASKLAKSAVRAGTSRTADNSSFVPFVGKPCSPLRGSRHSTGNRLLAAGTVLYGEGVQLTSPPGCPNPRRPASKLAKTAVMAGTSRTADQVRSSALWGKPCSPCGGRGHSIGNRLARETDGCFVRGEGGLHASVLGAQNRLRAA